MTEHAAELRREFDRGFGLPIQIDLTPKESLLTIRVGGQAFAIRLSEISSLFADKKVTPVPGGHPALRGIAGFRGNIMPVYDLAALIRFPRARSPRWLVIARAAPVALAFDAFDGQVRIAADAILTRTSSPEMQGYGRDFVSAPEFSGPIVDLPSVVGDLDALKFDKTEQQES
jgi:purine-binding chemotaxis protein CheW